MTKQFTIFNRRVTIHVSKILTSISIVPVKYILTEEEMEKKLREYFEEKRKGSI